MVAREKVHYYKISMNFAVKALNLAFKGTEAGVIITSFEHRNDRCA
jgi:hypothetical protein